MADSDDHKDDDIVAWPQYWSREQLKWQWMLTIAPIMITVYTRLQIDSSISQSVIFGKK